MMRIATILPGQWSQHLIYQYAVWVHRLARAVGAEIDRLPEKPPPLPWPVQKKPINELRTYNSGLFPKFPVKPKRRPHLNSYVPEKVDLSMARTEVYRPEAGDDFLWRIRICWDQPRPWEIEAVVDPGGAVYLPFFRQVTIRLPLKAKVCRPLEAAKDGRWRGECRNVKKLNVRVALTDTTKSLINNEQLIINNRKRKAPASAPAPDSRLLAPSPGVVAYRAKQAARARRATASGLRRRRSLDGALHVEGFGRPDPWGTRYQRPGDFARQEQEREELLQAELNVMQGLMWSMPWTIGASGPDFLRRDDHDGYLLTRTEIGPDPFEYRRPEPHWRWTKWGRRIKRGPTARERLAKVKPSARIVPTGPRSSELVITRRLHELSFGVREALKLARFIEGAIKYRNPLQSGRKPSWRQQLRSTILYRHGLLTWLIRNPMDYWEPGAGSQEPGELTRASRAPAPGSRLPAPYAELIDRRWVTSDGNLFAATPGGAFATSVEGYPLRLPVAVMPPEFYERWLARGGNQPRKRRRAGGRLRRRKRAGCTCYLMRAIRREFPNGRNVKSGFS